MRAHELQTNLKALKLGGMLLTLEMRRAQAEDQRLGHVEFLALLLEDEIDRRQSKMLTQRLHRARFEEQKTLEEFDFSYNPQIPAEQLRNLATCGFVERRESVLLCGPVGVGKTHAAQALGHAACRAGFTVLFAKTSAFLRDLAGGRADGTWEPRLRRYLQTNVLILDDFGMREFTPSQAEDLYELICERYRAGSMIVTSNRSPKDWYPLFPNPVLAESALDRLVNSAHHVILRGRTYRPLRRPDGGGSSVSDDEDELTSVQTGRSLQVRAAVRAQEPHDDVDVTLDTSSDDGSGRPRRRAKEQLPS
ncbi:MAG: ATP-binding protein [Candidatus Aeolococcus gillhamiae]|uniref:ATP-binding protein n=1 Tax=Candidatus Aeolococcus gillhamiae TaxID=3127015 RepID=A0A2W5ZF69_9BACT|nr:MAG: ATP-binding protein [Candidatus Dormibacter sp. RRmetagenome_bin12]